MKLIDQTLFFSEDGKISMVDRAKATMKFGAAWVKDTQAQQAAITSFSKVLDNRYTLLRNVTLPGLGICIPLILVGPTGTYTMYVTNLRGIYRAKGDTWGTISGSTFKPYGTNLLTLTARMARAVQVYLQRQGFKDLGDMEAVLLCTNPGMNMDSIRPIVRVIQSDALERFAISISQAPVVMTSEVVQGVIGCITNPSPAQVLQPNGTLIPTNAIAPAPEEEPYVPGFALPGNGVTPTIPGAPESLGGDLGFDFNEETAPDPGAETKLPVRKTRRGFTFMQWGCLGFAILVEIVILLAFYFVIRSL